MAHNTRTRVNLAAWANGTAVTQDELDKIDGYAYSAINGDAGGTWAPAAVIAIGGAGVELVNSPLVLSGTASCTVAGAASFTGSFSATGSVLTLGNNSTSTLALQAITTATKLVVCQGGFVSTGATTIGDASSDTCTVNAALTVANDCTIGENSTDNASFYSTEYHTGPETHTGAETHGGSQTYNGSETHNGTEVHNGTVGFSSDVTFTGQHFIADGKDTCNFSNISISVDQTRTTASPRMMIFSATTAGLAIRMSAPSGTPSGIRKTIKNANITAHSIMIVDTYSGQVLAPSLEPGDSVDIICDTARWY